MCKQDRQIKFCTCTEKDVNEKGNDVNSSPCYTWSLSSLDYKANEYKVMGRVIYPLAQLNKDFDKELILKVLNESEAFDFDYEPKENDVLKIKMEQGENSLIETSKRRHEGFMSFKFENGKWIFGRYPIHYMFSEIKKGNVKTEEG